MLKIWQQVVLISRILQTFQTLKVVEQHKDPHNKDHKHHPSQKILVFECPYMDSCLWLPGFTSCMQELGYRTLPSAQCFIGGKRTEGTEEHHVNVRFLQNSSCQMLTVRIILFPGWSTWQQGHGGFEEGVTGRGLPNTTMEPGRITNKLWANWKVLQKAKKQSTLLYIEE